MATTTTYSFEKPTVGGDDGTWGGKLNGNWDALDDLLDGTTPITGIDINSGDVDATSLKQGGSQAFLRSNLLGTVSQSGGTPTGAVIERGSNANGEFVRFADGTQICTHTIGLNYSSGSTCQSDWTFPAAFSTTPRLSGLLNASVTNTNITPSLAELSAAAWSNSGANTTTARISVYRMQGGTDFVSGDVVTLQAATAIGRWF